MYTALQHLHSTVAYLLLAILIFALLWSIISWVQGKSFTETSRKMALAGLIATHLQVLIGLLLYFVSPLGFGNFSGDAMQDSLSRLYILEHPLTMLIGAALVTVGYSRAKRRGDDSRRYRQIVLFFGLGLVLILSRIPWSVWP